MNRAESYVAEFDLTGWDTEESSNADIEVVTSTLIESKAAAQPALPSPVLGGACAMMIWMGLSPAWSWAGALCVYCIGYTVATMIDRNVRKILQPKN